MLRLLLLRVDLDKVGGLLFLERIQQVIVKERLFRAQQRIATDDLVIKVGQRLDRAVILFIDDQREPETQLGNINRAGVDVHAVDRFLDGVTFECVGAAVRSRTFDKSPTSR